MGFGSGGRGPTVDVGGNDATNEVTIYEGGPSASGRSVRIYATSGGVQVGCTFVSSKAIQRIVEVFKKY